MTEYLTTETAYEAGKKSAIEKAISLAEDHRSKAHAWKTDYSHQDDVKTGRIAALDELIDALRAI
jgi:hypothetical protein